MEIAIYVTLIAVASAAFEVRFRKTFFPSLIFGIILSPIFTLVLLTIANKAKLSIRDTWKPIEYPIAEYTADLPVFSKRDTEEEVHHSFSLRETLLSEERKVQASIDAYSREKHMRRLQNNDKRAFNRELFDFAQKKEWQLNTFVEREILYVLRSGILAETIGKDDFVDLARDKIDTEKYKFSSPDLNPYVKPEELQLRAEPSLENTPLPKLLKILPRFFKSPIHESLLKKNFQVWESEREKLEDRRLTLANDYEEAERLRQERLEGQKQAFDEAFKIYDQQARAHNAEVEMRLQGLEAGERSSVESYALKVLNNSSYPAEVAPRFNVTFHEATAELEVSINLRDSKLLEPIAIKYKLVKSRGAVEESPVTKTEFKKLYGLSIMQLMIRAAHEVSEADRNGTIKSISVRSLLPDLMSGAEVPVALLAGTPDEFSAAKLKGEVSALFKSLGGVISKDPIAASPVSTQGSIRGK